MEQLQPVDFPHVRPLFKLPHLGFVMDAMIAGNSPAVVYVDDPTQPRSAFVWDQSHGIYLAGAADHAEFNADLAAWMAGAWRSKAEQLNIIKIYATDEAWKAQLDTLLPGVPVTAYNRVLYAGDGTYMIAGWEERIPPGYTMHSIDSAFLTRPLVGMEETIEEIESCWSSMVQFYTDAFGYCLVTDTGAIASRCTAEYVSVGKCGIGIETTEAYQKRGFATLTASAFLAECQRRKMTPHWDSWAANTPSVAVAAKIGLKPVQEYAVQLARFADI